MSICDAKLSLADPQSIRALAIDLDGTVLTPEAVLTGRTVRAIRSCALRGIRIIITTGRAIEAAESFRSAFCAEGPMIYYNGAVLVDMPGNKILNTTLLDKKAAEFCVDLAREMGMYCQLYLPNGDFHGGNSEIKIPLLAELDSPHRQWYYKITGMLSELADLKEALGHPGLQGCVKTMFLAEPGDLPALRRKLEERFNGTVCIAQTHQPILEVTDAKATKGHGLNFVMDNCSIKKEEVFAFGDAENDLPMFSAAGFSIAPSNAKDAVKAAADIVVGSNAEDGVAAFLEEFFNLETVK